MKQEYEKFNLKETFIVNIFWIIHVGVLIFFAIKFANLINTFESENTALIASIVLVFGIIKLMSWVKAPKLCFKTKKGKLTDCYY